MHLFTIPAVLLFAFGLVLTVLNVITSSDMHFHC